MKKLLCTLLALSMLLGLAACGGPAPAESPSADPAPAVSTPAQPEDGSASFTDSVGRTVEVPRRSPAWRSPAPWPRWCSSPCAPTSW